MENFRVKLKEMSHIRSLLKRELSVYIMLIIVGVIVLVGSVGAGAYYYQNKLEGAEERAEQAEIQLEVEKRLKDVSDMEKEFQDVVIPQTTPINSAEEDSNIKIAVCQAKRDSDYSTLINSANNDIAHKVANIRADLIKLNAPYFTGYSECFVDQLGKGLGVEICSLYTAIIADNRDFADQDILAVEQSIFSFKDRTRAIVDGEYYECINK